MTTLLLHPAVSAPLQHKVLPLSPPRGQVSHQSLWAVRAGALDHLSSMLSPKLHIILLQPCDGFYFFTLIKTWSFLLWLLHSSGLVFIPSQAKCLLINPIADFELHIWWGLASLYSFCMICCTETCRSLWTYLQLYKWAEKISGEKKYIGKQNCPKRFQIHGKPFRPLYGAGEKSVLFSLFLSQAIFCITQLDHGALSHWVYQFCSEAKQKTAPHRSCWAEGPSPFCNQSEQAGSLFSLQGTFCLIPWQERHKKSLLLSPIFPLNACPAHGHLHSHLKPKQTLWHWTSFSIEMSNFQLRYPGAFPEKGFCFQKCEQACWCLLTLERRLLNAWWKCSLWNLGEIDSISNSAKASLHDPGRKNIITIQKNIITILLWLAVLLILRKIPPLPIYFQVSQGRTYLCKPTVSTKAPKLLQKTNSEIITACCFLYWSGLYI